MVNINNILRYLPVIITKKAKIQFNPLNKVGHIAGNSFFLSAYFQLFQQFLIYMILMMFCCTGDGGAEFGLHVINCIINCLLT